jgi:hypothetical protein
MIRTQISMTAEQAEALKRLAAARGVSQAAVMRDLLDELTSREIRSRRIAKVRTALGAFASVDGATADHDGALAEAFLA